MESSDKLASRHKTFTYYRHDYSVVNISILWDGGGGGIKILMYNILTPPPSKNIQEQYLYMESSDNLASRHKTFTYYRHDYSVVNISFYEMGGGGSKYHGIIFWPPPPSKNIQEQYLYMESSDNLASTHKTFTYHRQYYSMVDISF